MPGPTVPSALAFISGGGQLFMVKEGDTVTPRYRVAKISADVVELTDVDRQHQSDGWRFDEPSGVKVRSEK